VAHAARVFTLNGNHARRKAVLAPFDAVWEDESGRDLVEYALLVVLIAVAVIFALRILTA
jgi:Flp pilus assembly pilin Flp